MTSVPGLVGHDSSSTADCKKAEKATLHRNETTMSMSKTFLLFILVVTSHGLLQTHGH